MSERRDHFESARVKFLGEIKGSHTCAVTGGHEDQLRAAIGLVFALRPVGVNAWVLREDGVLELRYFDDEGRGEVPGLNKLLGRATPKRVAIAVWEWLQDRGECALCEDACDEMGFLVCSGGAQERVRGCGFILATVEKVLNHNSSLVPQETSTS